ncbi:MAG TPA: DUF4333 domain-containing protein, partial [Pedococcus sp.]|nr:DUF4333 domain-containing protein [Pedococcus sp.]HEV7196896.1 DUF4333 domain-containing protein [Pedococcus sp.]
MSEPFTPPGVQPTPGVGSQPAPHERHPAAAYPMAPTPAGQSWGPPQHPLPPQGYLPPSRRGNGLAITAVVLSAVALLVAIVTAVFVVAGISGGPSPALSGRVTPTGTSVAGSDLQTELKRVITDDGGSVDTITCPDRSQVGQGLVTVCKGSVDGFDWTGIVVFEDDAGTFVINE